MRRDINWAMDLFHPRWNKDDTEWADLMKTVKQVVDCKIREETETEQNQEVQVLIEEIQKLKTMVARQGVTPAPIPSLGREKGETSLPEYCTRPTGQTRKGFARTFCCIWCDL